MKASPSMYLTFVATLWVLALVECQLPFGENTKHTPFGMRHKDCILEVPSGTHVEAVNIDGLDHVHITHPDGTKVLREKCPHDLPQKRWDDPTWDGYAEHWWFGTDYAEFTNPANNQPVTAFTATWNVPPTPANIRPNSSAPWPYAPTLSFWTGLQPDGWFADVLQPVLEFNGLITGQYDLSSWNCCPAGYVVHSTPIGNVKPGDVIYGSMELVTPNDPYTYKIVSMLNNSQNTTLIANMTASAPRYTWAEVKSEGYYVTTCDQLPAKPINFNIERFVTSAGPVNVKTLPWTLSDYQCASGSCPPPLCHGTTTASQGTVSVQFH